MLAEAETKAVEALAGHGLEAEAMSACVRMECPCWLWAKLAHLPAAEWAALNVSAPVDLRVNTLKATRDAARAALAAANLDSGPTSLSPLGLRLPGRARLDSTAAFRDGLVEVQDEGSQLAALLLDAKPGMTVVDWCAGAGGKTLALAAQMKGEGRLIAGEANEGRIANLAERAERAGVSFIETVVPAEAIEAMADRVLVDAPCSGSGTWRRHPEAKWRLTPESLAEYGREQTAILDAASRRVKPGGLLLYVVCSLLPEEGSERVAAFLAAHGDFERVPARTLWARAIGTAPPAGDGDLILTPAQHGTDGFYIAGLERRA
jgi:16S rRNA (cytosine967-C5)-methyltransferase